MKKNLLAFNRSPSTQLDLSKEEKITTWSLETYSAKKRINNTMKRNCFDSVNKSLELAYNSIKMNKGSC